MARRKHAKCSASKAKQWMNCPPSAALEEKFPDKTSEYAEEGTAAHELCELTARYVLGVLPEMDYENQRDELAKGKYYSQEMQEYAYDYGTLVRQIFDEAKDRDKDAFIELETQVDFSDWVEEGFGTADCLIVADERLEVVDFKYGKGVRVFAQENPQMMLYAMGAYAAYGSIFDIKTVRMTIFQPRISSEPSSWELPLENLITWAEKEVKPKAKLAYLGKGNFNPSEETCRFCKAKAECKARAEANLKLFQDSPDPLLISTTDAAEILAKAGDIKAWLSDLEALITDKLYDGEAVPGWKLVEGRSVRKFASEDAVVKAMTAAGYEEALLYEKKLISLTQMEKDFGKKNVADILGDLLVRPQGKPTLAPESDKRPAIMPADLIIKEFEKEN